MARVSGKIGYVTTTETTPGVYTETVTEKVFYGDLIRNNRRLQNSGNVNDNIDISNEISMVADAYATNNFHSMRYVEFMGAKWKIESVEVERPRLKLSVGGLYNG